MQRSRRDFLAGLSAVGTVIAGCLGDPSPSGDGGEMTEESDNTDAETGDGTDGESEVPSESSYAVTVERVREETLAERFDVAILADQPPAVREALWEAIADRYETETVGDALASVVAGYEFVREDDAYYALDAKFPREVLTLTAVDREGIKGEAIAGATTFREDPVVADAISTAASHGEATRTSFPESLHELVAEYEYVTMTDPDDEDADIYKWSIETDDNGGPPYWLDATVVEPAAVFGDDVVGFESLSPAAREEIETAREQDRLTSDEQPAVLSEGSFRYVRIDGTVYSVAVSVAN